MFVGFVVVAVVVVVFGRVSRQLPDNKRNGYRNNRGGNRRTNVSFCDAPADDAPLPREWLLPLVFLSSRKKQDDAHSKWLKS